MEVGKGQDLGMRFLWETHRCLPSPPPALQSGSAGVRGYLRTETRPPLP